MLINGEIMSQSYWDTVTEEINEKLQERSQIVAQLHIGSELAISILEPRLETIVSFSCFFLVAAVHMLLFCNLNLIILIQSAISRIMN